MIIIRVGKLADALGVHRNTVRNWIKSDSLAATPTIGKKYAIKKEIFTTFLQSKGVAPESIDNLVKEMTGGNFPLDIEIQPETQFIQEEEVSMIDKPVGSVMVVGGGIAGIQASLDLADSGYYVYLLEKSPGIGGGMAKLDKTFPTNDCTM
jgi:excisionase family DNA binding protein